MPTPVPTASAAPPRDADVPEIVPLPPLPCAAGTAIVAAPAPEPTWACARPDGTRHGPFVTLFPDARVAIRGAYVDGRLDGAWERRHPDGALAETGAYVAGRKHGRWTQTSTTGVVLGSDELVHGTGRERRWRDDGSAFSEIALVAGVPHGAATWFTRDGAVIGSARYADGELHGAYAIGTRPNLRIEERYTHGTRTGPRAIWQAGAQLAAERFDRDGKHDGAYTLWRSRKIKRVAGRYAHGARVGAWVWHDRRGRLARAGHYVAGEKDGAWTEWSDGKVVFTGTYRAGKPDGAFTYYDRRGTVLGTFTIARGTGTLVTFWGNRTPASKQRLVDGVPHGSYQELTPRGTVVVAGHYHRGAKHGTWQAWSADGVLTRAQTWRHGKLDGPVRKYVAGVRSLDATYRDGQAHGPYVEYRGGAPAVTGAFVAGKKHGAWTHHAPDGSVVLAATYRDGVLEGPWRQRRDGVVIEGTMVAGRRTGTWTHTDAAGHVRARTYPSP